MSKTTRAVSWVFSVVIAVLYLRTLLFKFAGSEEFVLISKQLSDGAIDSLVRIGTGAAELITAILVVIRGTRVYGAIISVFVISVAILGHLFIHGIFEMNDNDFLLFSAFSILIMSILLIAIHRSEIPFVGKSS